MSAGGSGEDGGSGEERQEEEWPEDERWPEAGEGDRRQVSTEARGLSSELRNVRNSGSSCVSRSQFDYSIQKGDCDLFGLVFGLVNCIVAITRG